MARKQKFPKLSGEQAHAALRWLHALGKVTAKDIERALKKREELVAEIEAKLEALGGQLRFLTGAQALGKRAPTRRRSRKAQAAWKAQGQYLGAVRRLSSADRAKVKAIREKAGVRAAISAAKRIARR